MKKYTPILFIFFLLACELYVDVNVPFKHPQLTVNSIITPDSVWAAEVSLNQFILNDAPFQKVENALAVVYLNDSPIDTLTHRGNGLYKSDTGKPLNGLEYEIRVSANANGYEAIASHARIPLITAQINKVEITRNNAAINLGENDASIDISFDDNGQEVNYYHILAQAEYEYYDQQTNAIYTSKQNIFLESNTGNDNDYTNADDGVLIKDVLFNGKNVKLTLNTRSYFLNSGSIIITLRTVSEEYYKYKTTSQLQRNTSGDPFAQPVNVYNNIENGFGIFAGYSQSSVILTNPKPVITGIEPMTGKPGDHVIISGINLTRGYVLFNGNQNRIYSHAIPSTSNQLEVIVPDNAITGKLVIGTGDSVFISDTDFVVTN